VPSGPWAKRGTIPIGKEGLDGKTVISPGDP
jgi:hypothetical protein